VHLYQYVKADEAVHPKPALKPGVDKTPNPAAQIAGISLLSYLLKSQIVALIGLGRNHPMTLGTITYLALVSAACAFIEPDDCALLMRREARYPAFAFTSPYAVFAPAVPALRVLSHSLDAFLAADVPRFALARVPRTANGAGQTGSRSDEVLVHRAALARAGWTTCGVSTEPVALHLLHFVAFERILYVDTSMLAVGDLMPLFRAAPDALVAVAAGAALVRPDATVFERLVKAWPSMVPSADPWAGAPALGQLNATGALTRCDAATCWEIATRRTDAADADKRLIEAAHPAVIVTGYWSMPSKHGSGQYATWISHFMEVAVPMVSTVWKSRRPRADAATGTTPRRWHGALIFISTQVIFTNAAPELKKMRGKFGHGNLTKFVHREIEDFHTQRAFGETWKKDFARDHEAHYHKSPRLYAIWAEKIEHVEIARRRKLFGDIEAIFWVDIGLLRDTGPKSGAQYRLATGRGWIDEGNTQHPGGATWPHAGRVEAIVATDRVHITAAMPCFKPNEFANPDVVDERFHRKSHVCACIFGGSGAAVHRTRIAYYDMTQRFIAAGIFSGKDQSIWNMLIVQNRSFLELVVPERCPGNGWFAGIAYLANACHVPPHKGKQWNVRRARQAKSCLKDVRTWSGNPKEGIGIPIPTITR